MNDEQRAAYIENRNKKFAAAIEHTKSAVPGAPLDPEVAAALVSRARENALRAQGQPGTQKALLQAAYEAGMAAKNRLEQILAVEAAETAAAEQDAARLAAIKAAKLTSKVANFFRRKRT